MLQTSLQQQNCAWMRKKVNLHESSVLVDARKTRNLEIFSSSDSENCTTCHSQSWWYHLMMHFCCEFILRCCLCSSQVWSFVLKNYLNKKVFIRQQFLIQTRFFVNFFHRLCSSKWTNKLSILIFLNPWNCRKAWNWKLLHVQTQKCRKIPRNLSKMFSWTA